MNDLATRFHSNSLVCTSMHSHKNETNAKARRRKDIGFELLASLRLCVTILFLLTTTTVAQTRPYCTIRTDTVWSGEVELQSDVVITGATVRVEPGTVIRFTKPGKSGSGIVLSLRTSLALSEEQSRPAKLLLDGTPERPITVETSEGTTPGNIDGPPGTSAAIVARHVIFRRMGRSSGERAAKPAISIQLAAADNDLWLSDCRFEQCGPVRAEFIGPSGSTEISRCTFTKTVGPIAVTLGGPGNGIKILQDNVADAAFETACPNLLVRGNVLVGDNAAMVIRNRLAGGINVTGNYIHCTWPEDTGRYALRCEAPSTSLTDNVLIGGSYVLETTPQTVHRNVLIGSGNLQARLGLTDLAPNAPRTTTSTHSLVTNICPNAVIADNLLLGPAYAAVDLTLGSTGWRIEHNVLDGWNSARRALRFDVTYRDDSRSRVYFLDNIVMGYRQPPVCSEMRTKTQALNAGKNVFVGLAGSAYQGFVNLNDLAPNDRRVETLSSLGLAQAAPNSPATQAAADVDDLLTSRRKTVADVHKAWFGIYRASAVR